MARGFYTFPPGFRASSKMLDEAGLDFDGDLGGLMKGAVKPSCRTPYPALGALLIMALLLIWVNPEYGLGVVSGAVFGATGVLIADTARC